MTFKALSDKEMLQYKGLWHGMDILHFLSALSDGCLTGRTTQRYWKNGRTYFDDEQEYESSFFMKGWSTTRDRNYAFGWGDVVLLLDEDAIKRDFKVKPYSWASTMRNAQNLKKEREEFVIAEYLNLTFDGIKELFEKTIDDFDNQGKKKEAYDFLHDVCGGEGFIGLWRQPAKKTISIDKYVKGFFLRSDPYTDTMKAQFEELVSHPMFLGFYSKSKARENNKKSEPPYNYKLAYA